MSLLKHDLIEKFRFYLDGKRLRIEMESERLFIVSYNDSDFEDCLALYGNEILTRYFDHGKARNREEVEQLVDSRGSRYFCQGMPLGLFSLFDKPSKNFVGQVDLLPSDKLGVVEIGYILRSEYQNKGFCAEAVRALIQFIREINRKFKNISIHKVIATVHPENFASKKVLEKIGMEYQETLIRFGMQRLLYSRNLHEC